MTTFVLVHGWWSGGWVWDRVAGALEAVGHDVVTPTLLGSGERALELRSEIDLAAQIEDLSTTLRLLHVRDAVVVGHDYGAMVATGAVSHVPDRARELVYVDGLVADDGQSVFDVLPSLRPWFARLARRVGSEWRIPPPEPAELGVDDPPDVCWMQSQLTSMPWATQATPLRLAGPVLVPRGYVRCSRWPKSGRLALAAQLSGWPVLEVDAGHAAMITEPQKVADVLSRIAGDRRRVVDLRDRPATKMVHRAGSGRHASPPVLP